MEQIKMEIKELQRPERKEVIISVRTFPSQSEWMRKNKISPTLLFNKALEELKKKNK